MNSPCTISGEELSCLYLVSMKTIPLTQGYEAIVDDEDYEYLSQWKWSARSNPSGNWYARRSDGKRSIPMHREILKLKDGHIADHINGNGLDNRKENLRKCTWRENTRNRRKIAGTSSKYKGVHKFQNGWRADIYVNNKTNYLGLFKTEEEAALVYDVAAQLFYGEFAKLNNPPQY